MTGSQNANDDLSQEMKEMAICKEKSPTPERITGANKSPNAQNFIKRKLLDAIQSSPSAAARLRAIRLFKEVSQKWKFIQSGNVIKETGRVTVKILNFLCTFLFVQKFYYHEVWKRILYLLSSF